MNVRLLDEAVLGLVNEGTRVECAEATTVVLQVPLLVPRAAAGCAWGALDSLHVFYDAGIGGR